MNIKDDTTAPGLSEAKEKLQYLSMDKKDRIAYEHHLDAIMVQEDVLSTAKKKCPQQKLAGTFCDCYCFFMSKPMRMPS